MYDSLVTYVSIRVSFDVILYVHFPPHLAVIFYTNDSFMIHFPSDDSFTIHFLRASIFSTSDPFAVFFFFLHAVLFSVFQHDIFMIHFWSVCKMRFLSWTFVLVICLVHPQLCGVVEKKRWSNNKVERILQTKSVLRNNQITDQVVSPHLSYF